MWYFLAVFDNMRCENWTRSSAKRTVKWPSRWLRDSAIKKQATAKTEWSIQHNNYCVIIKEDFFAYDDCQIMADKF